MKRTFAVENVKCGGCAATLKNRLGPDFGEITVDLDVHPRTITLDIEAERIDALRSALRKLGYPMSDETLGFTDTATTKVKSFVSCAVGRMEGEK